MLGIVLSSLHELIHLIFTKENLRSIQYMSIIPSLEKIEVNTLNFTELEARALDFELWKSDSLKETKWLGWGGGCILFTCFVFSISSSVIHLSSPGYLA